MLETVGARLQQQMMLAHALSLCVLATSFRVMALIPDHTDKDVLELAKRRGYLKDGFNSLYITKIYEVSSDDQELSLVICLGCMLDILEDTSQQFSELENVFGQVKFLSFEHPWTFRRFDHEKLRRKSNVQKQVVLHIPVYDKVHLVDLNHQESVLNPKATVRISGARTNQSWKGPFRSCFLTGRVRLQEGSASFSYCDGLHGIITVNNVEHIIEPIQSSRKHLVATRNLTSDTTLFFDGIRTALLEKKHKLRKRAAIVRPKNLTVESAIYVDKLFNDFLKSNSLTTLEKKINYILVKWNGVQYEWSKKSELRGYEVKVDVKLIHFFETDPPQYKAGRNTQRSLITFCKWQQQQNQTVMFDHVHIMTGHTSTDVSGRGYMRGLCRADKHCALTADIRWGYFYSTAHELGHNFGMHHDSSTKCASLPSAQQGIMGSRRSGFSNCSAESFENFITSSAADCLFEENVKLNNASIKYPMLLPLLPGMVKTLDEYCEDEHGPGYRYRDMQGYEKACSFHMCVQSNPGPTFGAFRMHHHTISGKYCGPGKVCQYNLQCVPAEKLNLQINKYVQHGGWSSWEEFRDCQPTCGPGIHVLRRRCNNPKPLNSGPCTGNEFKGILCNRNNCNSVANQTTLRSERADEVCSMLIDNGFINGKVFNRHGRPYSNGGIKNSCEVSCQRINGKGNRFYHRFGFLPDGTPCATPDRSLYPTAGVGEKFACLQGYCQAFDSDGHYPPTDILQ